MANDWKSLLDDAHQKARRVAWLGIICAAVAGCWAAPARAQLTLDWRTVDGGGTGRASGGVYILGGTIGQPDAGVMSGGVYSLLGGFWRGGAVSLVGVDEDEIVPTGLPLSFRLYAGAPNPLVRHTVVAFDLPRAKYVRLRVYDATGRVARTLVEGSLSPGRHQKVWDGVDDHGRAVAAGVYFVRFDSDENRASQKITVLR